MEISRKDLQDIYDKIIDAKNQFVSDNKNKGILLTNDALLKLKDIGLIYDKETKDKMIDEFKDFLYDEMTKLTNPEHILEITPIGYDDYFPNDAMKEFINDYKEEYKENSDLTFDDYMDDNMLSYFMERMESYETDICKALEEKIYSASDNIKNTYILLKEQGFDFNDLLEYSDYGGAEIDWHDFIGEYNIDIMLATKEERNQDMTSIHNMVPNLDDVYMNKFINDYDKISDNALTYLLHSQGYTIKDLYEAMYDDEVETKSVFLDSVAEEIKNSYTDMVNLTIITKLNENNLEDFVDAITKKNKDIILDGVDGSYTLGLFNEWEGSGSLLEINLEKDFQFPAAFVNDVKFEGVYYPTDYTVNKVYGFVESAFRDTIKITDQIEKDKSIVENKKATLELFNAYKDECDKVMENYDKPRE